METPKKPVLVLVESPKKAKSLASELPDGFVFMATEGHIRQINPQSGADIDLSRMEEFFVEVKKNNPGLYPKLRAAIRNADCIYIATDPDREGELIAWHVTEAFATELKGKEYYRVTFREIQKRAFLEGVAAKRQIDMDLVSAARARGVSDRLIGYTFSAMLREVILGAKSGGRVQSYANSVVVERTLAIRNFVSKPTWGLKVVLNQGADFSVTLDRTSAEALTPLPFDPAGLAQQSWSLDLVEKEDEEVRPAAPFRTTTMSMEAGKAGLSSDEINRAMVFLHLEKMITYPRTDAVRVSEEAQAEAAAFIKAEFGDYMLPPQPRSYSSGTTNVQDAHECIRPIFIGLKELPPLEGGATDPAIRKEYENARLLYKLIWVRFVASQSASGVNEVLRVKASASGVNKPDGSPHTFSTSFSRVKFDGWRAITKANAVMDADGEKSEEKLKEMPSLAEGSAEFVSAEAINDKTKPPAKMTLNNLLVRLEKDGVGRPSTILNIESKLISSGCMTLQKDGKKTYFEATEVGIRIDEYLKERFPVFIQTKYTAGMEDLLDKIARGEQTRHPMLFETFKMLQECSGKENPMAWASRGTPSMIETAEKIATALQLDPPPLDASFDEVRDFIDKNIGLLRPSESQIQLAKQVAAYASELLTEEILASAKKCGDYITRHKEGMPPNEKQLSFAEKLLNALPIDSKIRLMWTEETRRSAVKTSEFIDKAKKAVDANGGMPDAPPSANFSSMVTRVAAQRGLTVPANVLSSKNKLEAWYNAHIQAKPKRGK